MKLSGICTEIAKSYSNQRASSQLQAKAKVGKAWLNKLSLGQMQDPGVNKVQRIVEVHNHIAIVPKDIQGRADAKALARTCHELRPDIYPKEETEIDAGGGL